MIKLKKRVINDAENLAIYRKYMEFVSGLFLYSYTVVTIE